MTALYVNEGEFENFSYKTFPKFRITFSLARINTLPTALTEGRYKKNHIQTEPISVQWRNN